MREIRNVDFYAKTVHLSFLFNPECLGAINPSLNFIHKEEKEKHFKSNKMKG